MKKILMMACIAVASMVAMPAVAQSPASCAKAKTECCKKDKAECAKKECTTPCTKSCEKACDKPCAKACDKKACDKPCAKKESLKPVCNKDKTPKRERPKK